MLPGLGKSNLSSLNLSNNPMGPEGVQYLVEFLSAGPNVLTQLLLCNLGGNGVLEAVLPALRLNCTQHMRILDLSENKASNSKKALTTESLDAMVRDSDTYLF